MSIYRHTDKQVAAYHASPEMNQTALKEIINSGMQSFLQNQEELLLQDEWYSEKKHFKVGGAADYYISQGEDQFRRNYHFSSMANTPSGLVLAIAKRVFDVVLVQKKGQAHRIEGFDTYRKEIYDACNTVETVEEGKIKTGYFMNRVKSNWEEDTRYESLIKAGAASYFEELVESTGKTVLSEEEGNCAITVAKSILEHPHTRNLFNDDSDTDIIYQLPLFFEYRGVACKALIDFVRINHKLKRIYPMDFKSIGRNILQFNDQLRGLRYDIQGAFYSHAVEACLQQIRVLIGKDIHQGYEIANFAFIAESTKSPGTPIIFPLSNEALVQARYGDGKRYDGYEKAFATYTLWKENSFSLDNLLSHYDGVIFIDQFFEYSVNL